MSYRNNLPLKLFWLFSINLRPLWFHLKRQVSVLSLCDYLILTCIYFGFILSVYFLFGNFSFPCFLRLNSAYSLDRFGWLVATFIYSRFTSTVHTLCGTVLLVQIYVHFILLYSRSLLLLCVCCAVHCGFSVVMFFFSGKVPTPCWQSLFVWNHSGFLGAICIVHTSMPAHFIKLLYSKAKRALKAVFLCCATV